MPRFTHWTFKAFYKPGTNKQKKRGKKKGLHTFAERLCAGPGPVGEAHPLRGADQLVALRAAEVNLGTDPEIRLLPGAVGGDAGVAAGAGRVACREETQAGLRPRRRPRSHRSTLTNPHRALW